MKWSNPDETPQSDRRSELRVPSAVQVTLSVPGDSCCRQILTNDRSFNGLSFSSAESMRLGQDCQVVLENTDGSIGRFIAKVVRHRNLADGSFEIALQFKRQIAA